jgi:hypothetical protein
MKKEKQNFTWKHGPLVVVTLAMLSVHGQVQAQAVVSDIKAPYVFLDAPQHTHRELWEHMVNDPVVLKRYMDHFGMTQEQLKEFIGSLKLKALDQDQPFYIYFYDTAGKEGRKFIVPYVIKKGESVWVDTDGQPILRAFWGNPFLEYGEEEEGVEVFGVDGSLGWAAGLLPLGLLGFAGGGGDGGDTPNFPPGGSDPDPDPVPEPMSLLVLSSGAAWIAARMRSKKSQ